MTTPLHVALGALLLAAGSLAATAAAGQQPADAPTPACLTDGRVHDLLLHQGVVYLAGDFTHLRPPGAQPGSGDEVARNWFAACDARTGAVLGWDPQVACDPAISSCTGAGGRTLALSTDGAAVFLGGKFNQVGPALSTRRNAARVALADATVASWNPAPNDRVQRLVVAPAGNRVYLAGNFTNLVGCSPGACPRHLLAVDPDTAAVDPSFAPEVACDDQGGSCFTTVYAVLPAASGEVLYLGGQFGAVNGVARTSVAAIDVATGQTTLPFAPQLADTNPSDPAVQVYDLAIDGTWIYVCGDWWQTAGLGDQQNQRNVNRFAAADGAVDLGFWIATDGGVQACAIDPDLGLLLVGGHFDCVRAYLDATTPVDPNPAQCGSDPLFLGTFQRDLFALGLAEGALAPWNPDTGGTPGVWAMVRDEGRLLVGGEIRWPRLGPDPSHQNLLAFDLPLLVDGFESGDTARWSVTVQEPEARPAP